MHPRLIAGLVSAFLIVGAQTASAKTYDTVTLAVPITVDALPIGTKMDVECQQVVPGSAGSKGPSINHSAVPVQESNGFVSYHGDPILVVLQGHKTDQLYFHLTSGQQVRCGVVFFTNPGPALDDKQSQRHSYFTLP